MLSGQNICFNDPQNGLQVYVKPPFPVLVVFYCVLPAKKHHFQIHNLALKYLKRHSVLIHMAILIAKYFSPNPCHVSKGI